MLTNQNLESSKMNNKKSEKHNKMHNLIPLTPYDTNIQIPMIKQLGKYQFSIDQKLGSGMAGDAYVGINLENGELVCVKVIDKQLFKTERQKTMLQHEIQCQKLIECENTIKILDVFDQNSFCFIITQFCEGGDLYRLLRFSPDGLPEYLVRKFGLQVAKALQRLKEMQIIHRDIKPENILLRHEVAKLGDFGFAIQEKKLQEKDELNIGSPLYMSLEALQNNQYSYSSDVFSYGIVLYEMLHKISPWECSDQNLLKQKMKTQEIKFKEGVSDELKSLISGCLRLSVEDRMTIEQILGHQFFKQSQQTWSEQEKTEQKTVVQA